MVKHVVMWRFADEKDIEIARDALENMKGRVSAVRSLEVGRDFLRSGASFDLVLITEHEDREKLEAYQADPLHGEVKKILGGLKSDRVVVDFEI